MSLLDPDEPAAFETVRARGESPWVLLCDHASRRLPRALGTLGLTEDLLATHIAWDIGAALLARGLADALDAPLVLSGYSRLAIDCNRPLGVPASVPAVTCEISVPGNAALAEGDLAARRDELFWPYHRAVEALLAAREARGRSSAILSVHSFTPSLYGADRPWHLGVMYGKDRRLAERLLHAFAKNADLVVGDNQPYRVTDGTDYGIPTYAERAGRLGVLLEVRQDLIEEASGIERMRGIVAQALSSIDLDHDSPDPG